MRNIKITIIILLLILSPIFVNADDTFTSIKLIQTNISVNYNNNFLSIDTEDEDLAVNLTNVSSYSHVLYLDFLRELDYTCVNTSADVGLLINKFNKFADIYNTSINCEPQLIECIKSNTKLSTEIEKVYNPERSRCMSEKQELQDKLNAEKTNKWVWVIVAFFVGILGIKGFEKAKFARPPEEKLPREPGA